MYCRSADVVMVALAPFVLTIAWPRRGAPRRVLKDTTPTGAPLDQHRADVQLGIGPTAASSMSASCLGTDTHADFGHKRSSLSWQSHVLRVRVGTPVHCSGHTSQVLAAVAL